MKRSSHLNRNTPLGRARGVKPSNRLRRLQRFTENYGTSRRVEWFHRQPCACQLPVLPDPSIELELVGTVRHPECRGPMQASHTRGKAVEGDLSNCIPQTAGCHAYIGSKGWARWCREVGELHGLDAPLDHHQLAADYAMRGPDAPQVMP